MQRTTAIAERGTVASLRLMLREMPQRMEIGTRETLEASAGADVITGGVGGMVLGLGVAEKLGIPFVEAHLQPIGRPTGRYPGVLLSGLPSWTGAWGRVLSHHLSDRMTAAFLDKIVGANELVAVAEVAMAFMIVCVGQREISGERRAAVMRHAAVTGFKLQRRVSYAEGLQQPLVDALHQRRTF